MAFALASHFGKGEGAMNYRLAIIIIGVLMFVVAMIPYTYEPRCTDADCHPTRPY